MATWDKDCIYLVVWDDASKNSNWTPYAEARIDKKSSRVYSVGWVVRESKQFLLLGSSVGKGQCCLHMQIPKVAIVRRKRLKE